LNLEERKALAHKLIGEMNMEEFWLYWNGLQRFQNCLARWEIKRSHYHIQDLISGTMNQIEGLYK
jgi:hypothetical protein